MFKSLFAPRFRGCSSLPDHVCSKNDTFASYFWLPFSFRALNKLTVWGTCCERRLKETTPPFLAFCAIKAYWLGNQWGERLLTLIRDYLVFQKVGAAYSPTLECLTFQVQLSQRRLATLHNIYAAPIGSVGTTVSRDISSLSMDHLAFMGDDFNAHSPLWTQIDRAEMRGRQVEYRLIARPACRIGHLF